MPWDFDFGFIEPIFLANPMSLSRVGDWQFSFMDVIGIGTSIVRRPRPPLLHFGLKSLPPMSVVICVCNQN
jgi:hypothetical protein